MWKYIPFAFKNTLRNKRRTLLTIASVAVSILLLAVLIAVYHAFYFREGSPQEALRLVVRNRVSLAFALPEHYEQRIRQLCGVREVGSLSWFGGVYIDSRPEHFFPRFATDPEKIFLIYPEMKISAEQLKAFQSERTSAAIGKSLAQKHNLRLGQRIVLKGDIYPTDLELTIRAIFEGTQGSSDNVLYFHRKYLQEGLPQRRQGYVGTFGILADAPESVPRIAREVDDMFRNADRQTKTDSERAFQLSFVAMLGNVKLFLLSICSAVVFTILLVSTNTMAMSVRERIKEIGVLKTLGFTTGKVLAMIIAESVIVAMIGGVVGCSLAYLVGMGLGGRVPMMSSGLLIPSVVPTISLAVAFVIGVVSSVFPAFHASHVPITDALRHVG
ncbi:MAG: FtsX-like permease family protein [Acidobacteria bacterium]|nr:FtsX-like permease family protein [Acidobacteriota bacterium]MBI3657394.1 FtsX-like permease family protein [Acidobacteriota bacterium]